MAKRKDVAGKWEEERRLWTGEEKRYSPDSFESEPLRVQIEKDALVELCVSLQM